MAGVKDSKEPIIVKRVKKADHGAHGGVWKIVYADFVTAMMAFFLLMWVLGSTTTGDLAGISSYFQNPLRLTMEGGQGSGNSENIIKGGGPQIFRTEGLEARADADTEQRRISDATIEDDIRLRKNVRMQEVRNLIEQQIAADAEVSRVRNRIFMDISTDGLRIQIVDEQNRSMFSVGGSEMAPFARNLMRIIGRVLADMPNLVRIEGHTDGLRYPGSPAGYSNWELSTERANAARRELVVGGLAESRVSGVIGFADTVKLNPGNPNDPLNRRISITVQYREAGQTSAASNSRAAPIPAKAAASAPPPPPMKNAGSEASTDRSSRSPVLVLPPRPQITPSQK